MSLLNPVLVGIQVLFPFFLFGPFLFEFLFGFLLHKLFVKAA